MGHPINLQSHYAVIIATSLMSSSEIPDCKSFSAMDEKQERLSEACISTVHWATRNRRSPSLSSLSTSPLPLAAIPRQGSEYATFPYETLTLSRGEIRILRLNPGNSRSDPIFCSLFAVPLDDAPSYESLSYTWGVPGDGTSWIYVNGLAVDIRENLYRALVQLRSTTATRLLWIDALCIDQCNQAEVGDQVAKMGAIYAGANRVIVWLGEASANSGLAFSLLDSIMENLHNDEIVGQILRSRNNDFALDSLSEILRRDYWSRVWVIQEAHFAKQIAVHCGRHSIPWIKIVEIQKVLIERFLHTLNEVSQDPTHGMDHLQYLRHAIQFRGPQSLVLDRSNLCRDIQQIDLFECLMMHRLKEATDPRDKIYALVGLTRAANDPSFVIDYKLSTRQVFIDTVDYLRRKTEQLDIILVQTKGYEHDFSEMDLPTWVPDFGSTGKAGPVPFRYAVLKSAYNASALRKAEAQVDRCRGVLKAVGIRIGSIKAIAPSINAGYADYLLNGVATVELWKQYVLTHLGKSSKHSEHLTRLLLCDIIMPEDLRWTTESAFLQSILALFEEDHWPELCSGLSYDQVLEPQRPEKQKARSWVQVITTNIFERNLFITSNDGLGMAQDSVLEGDLICILFGCSVPVILREIDGHYTLTRYQRCLCFGVYVWRRNRGIKARETPLRIVRNSLAGSD
jgi:hypothetical protein